MKTKSQLSKTSRGFTLIELLVVISIIGVLAAFTIPVFSSLKLQQYKKVARGELEVIQTALENYKASYGAYPPSNQNGDAIYGPPNVPIMYASQFPQLYYELAGTTNDGIYYTSLDGSSLKVPVNNPGHDVKAAFGVAGFVNTDSAGKSGEDAQKAKNFLINLRSQQISSIGNNGVTNTILVTSIKGPDANYLPFGANTQDINPIRYVYPGVKNPNSYDLWIKFQFKNKTYLVCNWTREVIVNSSLP